jgi:hypothetical protein
MSIQSKSLQDKCGKLECSFIYKYLLTCLIFGSKLRMCKMHLMSNFTWNSRLGSPYLPRTKALASTLKLFTAIIVVIT